MTSQPPPNSGQIGSSLSPAAQAVFRAAISSDSRGGIAAAALRAAADQVVPHEYLVGVDVEVQARQLTRLRLLAIAAELEAKNDAS